MLMITSGWWEYEYFILLIYSFQTFDDAHGVVL